jgi:lipoic acid synthetase
MDKPPWLKIRYNPASARMKETLAKYRLDTVCQGAHCPNSQECWSAGTATFLVLGNECTRNCRFCAIATNPKPKAPDKTEPERLAKAVFELGLRYVVLTSVDRDDLPDYGAGHFSDCIRAIKGSSPKIIVEALVPDFNNDEKAIRKMTRSGVDVLGHNIETVGRLSPKVRDARADYGRSLEVLRSFKDSGVKLKTKSSIMLGLGEEKEEVITAMKDLRAAKVDILTLGQYLRPGKKQLPVERYVEPDEFNEYARIANALGFRSVVSGPLVRSSYHAAKAYEQ